MYQILLLLLFVLFFMLLLCSQFILTKREMPFLWMSVNYDYDYEL